MTEDSCPRVSSSEFDSSVTKQRKKRKWDQPDESLISAGVAVPGIFPLANTGYFPGPAISLVAGASLAIPFSTCNANPLQAIQVPLQQHAAAIVQKLIQPKIQDELIIAREIVINDADAAIRYKLTKRQTQEEIQKSTGAVVITRGKYHPPNAPPDGERPLYLHISAASHLDTTAERIKAVDRAAAMVEEMLKQPMSNSGVKVDHLLNTCIFLGFEVDPSVDIASRIRGPNDQFVNHIMNETGAIVSLRGQRSGFAENGPREETQQPLHLFLSSNDTKSLEHAKLLAENLLDTICAEFGASRLSSCKVYGAVPPPPQLQAGVNSPGIASKVNDIPAFMSTISAGLSSAAHQSQASQPIALPNSGLPQTNTCYPHVLTSGTSYIGYGGIYPQATALQQVALALRQSTSPVTATVSPATTAASTSPSKEVSSLANDKRSHSQRRKFQELPAASTRPAHLNKKNIQGSEFTVPRELTSHVGVKDKFVVQDAKEFVKPSSSVMPPPPPKNLPPPPPPPKFDSTPKVLVCNHGTHRSKIETVPDTLIKLMEYGDDDDDDNDNEDLEATTTETLEKCPSSLGKPKPFWAV